MDRLRKLGKKEKGKAAKLGQSPFLSLQSLYHVCEKRSESRKAMERYQETPGLLQPRSYIKNQIFSMGVMWGGLCNFRDICALPAMPSYPQCAHRQRAGLLRSTAHVF